MVYKRFRMVLSRGWALIVCSISVAVIALAGCRSKKVNKSADADAVDDNPTADIVEESDDSGTRTDLSPILILPSDSKETKEMIEQVNSLKEELSGRMNSVIYGPPEVMQRRAQENRAMRAQIDSLSNEINKARKK